MPKDVPYRKGGGGSPSATLSPLREVTQHKRIEEMRPEEVISYIQGLQARLAGVSRRTQNYLARRAHSGRQTPTDEVMQGDLLLYEEVSTLLGELLTQFCTDHGLPPFPLP